MKKILYFISIALALTGSVSNAYGQELPSIINYSPKDYNGDNQNWQSSQSDDGIIYIANNKGLLSFNGEQWHLNLSPNETIIRSVQAIKNRIYTGAHMDFGYWEKGASGQLSYTSLKDSLGINMIEGEQIWRIRSYKNKVLLQSLNGIYVYNPEESSVNYIFIDSKHSIHRIFSIDDFLYFQVAGKGLYTIQNGKAVLFNDHELFKTTTFINIFKRKSDWLGITRRDGFYSITDVDIVPWEHTASDMIKNVTVYGSIELSDGGIALGTVANGFIKLNKLGDLAYHFTQEIGLGNNTVLSIFEDSFKNIWVGLDNGIACINTEFPVRNFIDKNGRLGTTYTSAFHKGVFYLGTNQGLFYRAKESNDFKLVPGTEEQVWSLKIINDQLFCGHNKGTFLIEGGEQELIGNINGTWDILEIPNNPNVLLQGNYDGLYVLEQKENKWAIRNKISGFDISSRHLEFVDDHKILVGNEYKGVFEIEVDTAFAKANSQTLNSSIAKGEHSSLEKFMGKVYYANKEGIFKYNEKAATFEKELDMSTVFEDGYISGKLVNDGMGKLWAFTESSLINFSENSLESGLTISRIQIPQSLRNTVKGFENIKHINENEYLVGTTSGYFKIKDDFPEQEYEISINRVFSTKRDGAISLVSLDNDPTFTWKENSVSFDYHVAQFDKFRQTQYQYRLLGFYDNWSKWGSNATQEYANIPSGDYTFEVRARVGSSTNTTNVSHFNFSIARPWYITYVALALYSFATLLIILLISARSKRRYKKHQEQLLERTKREMNLETLAIEKENIELRNENLQKDIATRNRELAASTMDMVKKSKILQEVKDKLTDLEPSKELDKIIKDIDKNISTKQDWKFFEEAFNHADKDFFKKVKDKHPLLTTNDLKLCVYLRLNMTSKEIAPMLNISHRSVEIKRYRLRKKLNLDRNVQLNDYFIKF